jgi:hypothetical protein
MAARESIARGLSEVPAMDENVVARWQNWEATSLEHLVLRTTENGPWAESVIVGVEEGDLFGVHYRVICDKSWCVRKVEIDVVGNGRTIDLLGDGSGNWTDGLGKSLPQFRGAKFIDMPVTPFTNTLPIRHLKLRAGQSADIVTVYIELPAAKITADPQRYICLEENRRYRYDSLDSDFTREIEVDANNLVVTYPGLFRRMI